MAQVDRWLEKAQLIRRRFAARQDTFGVVHRYPREVKENGVVVDVVEEKSIIPQCENYGNQKLCLIAQRKGGCSECTNRLLTTITDEWVWKHISGEKELVFYLLTSEGIKFGACDFDYNEPFKDALRVAEFSRNLGLPCYIARSSKKGYHLYWFFDAFIPAHLFTSLIVHIYDQLGFYERFQMNPEITLPECFPKQTHFADNKFGNGIKIPMIEPRMKEGFNCFVDDEANPIPLDKQWQYLDGAKEISKDLLEKVLSENKIEIIHAPVTRGVSSSRHMGGSSTRKTPYTPPVNGNFEAVVTKCPALAAFWDKDEGGNYKVTEVPHMVRVASLSLALHTKNGLDIIRGRWSSDRTEKEIQYGIETNQRPWTCQAIQAHGFCHIGVHPKQPCKTKCFDKKPPVLKQDGRLVVNPDGLQPSEWPEPSPIRFAHEGAEKLTYEQIMERLRPLTNRDERPEAYEDLLQGLIKSSRFLKSEERKKVDDFISRNKMLGKREFKQMEKVAERQIKEEETEDKKASLPNFNFDGFEYFIEDGGYTMSYADGKGNRHTRELTNFTINIKEEVEEINSIDDNSTEGEKSIRRRIFVGDILVDKQKKPFRCPAEEWLKSADAFFSMIVRYAGSSVICKRADFDHIKICVTQFSKRSLHVRKKVMDIGHHIYQGADYYLMPNTIVTKDEIKPNSEFEISFEDDIAKQLGFAIVDEAGIKEIGKHIINDYFNSNSRLGAMLAFAHSMGAAVISHMPFNRSPILWLSGDAGGGKSFILESAQCFFGDFRVFKNMGASDKSKLQTAMDYRHALLYVDDYKQSLERYPNEFYKLIQNIYDRTGRSSLKRDGTHRERAVRARGLVSFSGEEYPIQEESGITRMLIAEIGKFKDPVKGERVLEMRSKYSAITAHFVKFIYNIDRSLIKELFMEYIKMFDAPIKDRYENTLRISQNLAFNMVAFKLAMELFYAYGVIHEAAKEQLIREHVRNLENVRTTVCGAASAQKGCKIFLEGVSELLHDRSRYFIEGFPDHEDQSDKFKTAKPLGFWKKETPKSIYLYPQVAYGEVRQMVGKSFHTLQSHNHIGRQLVSQGHISQANYDPSSPTFSKQVKNINGNISRVWIINIDSIGLKDPEVVPEDVPIKKSEASNADDFLKNIQ